MKPIFFTNLHHEAAILFSKHRMKIMQEKSMMNSIMILLSPLIPGTPNSIDKCCLHDTL